MELSKRLNTVAGAVTPGHRLADIGTDHGYVPIYLLKHNICPSALAMDVNRGPLSRAREHIRAEKLENRIELRRSDGLAGLCPEEVDTIVIAGMGGELICRILQCAPEFLKAGKELVLQPQSEWFKVRHFLHEHGYGILQEWFLKEDGKYYVVIKAVPAAQVSDGIHRKEKALELMQGDDGLHYVDEADYQYGYHLIREGHPVLLEYLRKEREKKRRITAEMEKQNRIYLERYTILKKEIEIIDRIIRAYYDSEPDDKPGYVVNDHLSDSTVAGRLKRPT